MKDQNTNRAKDLQYIILSQGTTQKTKMYYLNTSEEQGINFNNGYYELSTIINSQFGTKIFSKNNMTWCYLIKPTPQLYTRYLLHKTQILYTPDISMILHNLSIKPGCKILESGTGSGSLSSNIAQRLQPSGHLYTFQFNEKRAEIAVIEFKKLKLDKFITVTHRDVLKDGFQIEGIFNSAEGADGVFLDLPSPQLAIPHASRVLKYYKSLCSFSPCIEQVQETCKALKKEGFRQINTIQVLNKQYGFIDIKYRSIQGEKVQQAKNKRNQKKEGKYLVEQSPLKVHAKDFKGVQQKGHSYAVPATKMRGHTGFLTFAKKFYKEDDFDD